MGEGKGVVLMGIRKIVVCCVFDILMSWKDIEIPAPGRKCDSSGWGSLSDMEGARGYLQQHMFCEICLILVSIVEATIIVA